MNATCPECGKPLGPNALQGLCPECMMRVGLGSEVRPGRSAAGPASPGKPKPFMPPTFAELAPMFPQLEILGLIGQGGMGAVYQARQRELDRIVALKILPPGIGQDAAFAERFAREAKALARLNHPGIVTLYEFGHVSGAGVPPAAVTGKIGADARIAAGGTPAPLYYFLMEYVDGVNLRQLLNAGRVAPREALAIVPQICDALQYAHDQSIVHRDIKPENILLDRRGRVKVADFGVAKLVGSSAPLTLSLSPSDGERVAARPGEGAGSSGLTEAGKVIGTPQYMAPEQLEHPGEVDHRADIYALGMVFYQMLTGEMPGKPIEPPSHKVQIDVRLDEVVLRALEKDPARRYSQASVLKTQIETIATTSSPEGAAPNSGLVQSAAAQGQPEIRQTTSGIAPRLSRTALTGAAWAFLFFAAVTLVGLFGPPYSGGHYIPVELLLALGRVLLGLALSAVFGATILGGVAFAQIRRSAGRLRGLGLAVFDGLCFPLLALDVVILGVVRVSIGVSGEWGAYVPFVLLLAILVLDFFIVRAIWRRVSQPVGRRGASAAAEPRPVSPAFLAFACGSMALGVFFVTALTLLHCGRIVDNINLPFVDDPAAIGRWTSVDFVHSPEQFKPESRSWRGNLYLKELVLLPGGRTPDPWQTWTKGVRIDKGEKTAARYEIKEIGGTNYLFMEWKSGDYSYSREKPAYYVLRWSGSVTPDGTDPAAVPAH